MLDDGTYVAVGSAFEALDTPEDRERAKARKNKEHYVTDEQGRRRFHGAFTGGFSAGYYNTVGSEEGWEPSAFVSSRSKKADVSHQRPEDFMDKEDLGVHGIAPRSISAKDEFNQRGGGGGGGEGGGRKREAGEGVIPGAPPLETLVVPVRSTIGVQLLRALGWKEGQGVGPKVTKYPGTPVESSSQPKTYMYSCSLSGLDKQQQQQRQGSGGGDKAAESFQFAPRDVTPWQAEGKDNLHGIGYSGMEGLGVLAGRQTTGALYGMSGEAFGVGALDEEDDHDVYGVESMTSYDITLAGEGDIAMERKYGWTGGHDSDTWSLASFAKALKPLATSKRYPPPAVPRHFVPLHKFSAATGEAPSLKRSGRGGREEEEGGGTHHKPLTSTDRAQLLSDRSGSVFSLLSAGDRDRLRRASELSHTGGKAAVETPPPKATPLPASTTSKPPDIKPFASDSAKQARYEAYLRGEESRDSGVGGGGGGGGHVTEWERHREREEFARTERIFQPLASSSSSSSPSSLSSRFTRGGTIDQDRGGGGGGGGADKDAGRDEVPLLSDALQAAKVGMFGVLTRETLQWHPHRILCKRFNIPDPYPGSNTVGVGSDDKRDGGLPSRGGKRDLQFKHSGRMTVQSEEAKYGLTAPPQSSSTATEVGEKEVKQSQEEASAATADKEDTRPPMDLFKTIFAESSSDSDLSDEDESVAINTEETAKRRQTFAADKDEGSRKTNKWVDLSTVTNKVAVIATTTETKPIQSETISSRPTASTVPPIASTPRELPTKMTPPPPQNQGLLGLSSSGTSKLCSTARHEVASERTGQQLQPVAEVVAASGEKATEKLSTVVESFGPALPAGLQKESSSSESSDGTSRKQSKHKHKKPKAHKEKKKSKRTKKETVHKKSKHKHSKHKYNVIGN